MWGQVGSPVGNLVGSLQPIVNQFRDYKKADCQSAAG
jgi:hypothetical protein